MKNKELKSLARKLIKKCLNPKDHSLVKKYYSSKVVFHGGRDGVHKGHKAIIQILKAYKNGFPNLKYKVKQVLQDGNNVTIRWIATTDTETKGSTRIPGITILRYKGSKVKEIWQEWDRELIKS